MLTMGRFEGGERRTIAEACQRSSEIATWNGMLPGFVLHHAVSHSPFLLFVHQKYAPLSSLLPCAQSTAADGVQFGGVLLLMRCLR